MKLFLKLLAGLFSVLVLSVVVLLIVIDPNDYKQEIQAQVKTTINRDLLINGDIGWTFYPQLGLSSGEIELNNLDGFNRKHLLKIDNAAIGLQVFPLFKGEIKIGELTLNGLVLNLITNKDGLSNLDNMTSHAKEIDTPQPERHSTSNKPTTQQSGFFAIDKAQLAGINIKNAVIEVQDLQTNSMTKVDINHIKLGEFIFGKETDLSILTALQVAKMDVNIDLQAKLLVSPDFSSIQVNNLYLKTLLTGKELPNGKVTTTLKSSIHYDLKTGQADLSELFLAVDKITLKGTLSIQANEITKVRFDLQGNEWDLNPYIPPTPEKKQSDSEPPTNTTETAGTATKSSSETVSEQEPDLSFLHTLDVNGSLVIAGLKASGLTIGKIDTVVIINKGKAQIKPLTAEIYEGLLTLNAWVDDANGLNKYKLSSKVNNVQIRPLLIDAADIDLLSGRTAFEFYAIGQGLTASKVKNGLVGNGDFELTDGELYGVNISQELRTLKAKLNGKTIPTDANIKKTDFGSLTGEFSISKGIMDNNKLLMLSPVMRLDGLGLIDILQESLDYKLNISPLIKDDGENALHDINGITIPLLIKGPFTAPEFRLDMDDVLKQQLKVQSKKLEQKAKAEFKRQQRKLRDKSEQEIKDKLKKELGRIFG